MWWSSSECEAPTQQSTRLRHALDPAGDFWHTDRARERETDTGARRKSIESLVRAVTDAMMHVRSESAAFCLLLRLSTPVKIAISLVAVLHYLGCAGQYIQSWSAQRYIVRILLSGGS